MHPIATELRRHRGRLAATYLAVVLENAFELLYPFAIGLAVDGLLDDDWTGVVVFVGISITHSILSLLRQVFDTRSFNRLHVALATGIVERQRERGVETSTLVARTGLAREYVSFLEEDVVVAIGAAFAVVGSVVMLLLYDPVVGLAALAVAVPVAFVNLAVLRTSRRTYRDINDHTESEVEVIERAAPAAVRRHFTVLGRHHARLSDVEAGGWGLVEVLGIGLAVFALYRTTDAVREPGVIFATVTYVWAYAGGFDALPNVLQRLSNLGDIRARLAEEG